MHLNRLNSIAHNLAHWFGSNVNFWGGLHAYGINFLAGEAEAFPNKRVTVNVLTQTTDPPLDAEANKVIEPLRGKLESMLATAGLDLGVLSSAKMEFDFDAPRPRAYRGQPVYDCLVTLTTADGKSFSAMVTEGSHFPGRPLPESQS